MPNLVEFRVRKVTRYVVTRYHESFQDGKDGNSVGATGGIRTIGPFDNIKDANEVAAALHRAEPGSTLMPLDGIEAEYPPHPVTPSHTGMSDDGKCLSCVDGACTAGENCVACSHTN